ncbi:DUF397 domain-containing protein [Actinomadura luteofluorescens]|uniref:DUF397 domain-containing protein n=1 Tax=Actinomadura luteofluorescens TaxID=46163 RepID=UPI00348E1ADD
MKTSPRWRKSTHSGGDEGECVEVAELNDHIGVRDSKNPAAGHLVLTRQHFTSLLSHLASRREETRQAMLDKLRKLDGSAASSVSLLTDIPAEDVERLGGISEDT